MDVPLHIFFTLCLITVICATKEDAIYGSSESSRSRSSSKTAKHLIELIKRISEEKGVDLNDFPEDEDITEKCKTTKVTRNSIIKSSDSIASGAKYVSSHKKIQSLTECSKLCCDDPDCDTAIYQENKLQHCYLFACQEFCKFTEHVDYAVVGIRHVAPSTPPQPRQHEEEAQLENLHDHVGDDNGDAPASAEQSAGRPAQDVVPFDDTIIDTQDPVTVTPTPAPQRPYVAPHTAGLNEFCTSEVSCEDPNAGCFEEKCGCRQSYYNKAGLCRKVCSEYNFECLKLGSLTRGPECVPKLQVCDSYMQCADGSDEFNCENSAGNTPGRSWNQQYESPPSSWPDRSDQANYNNNINNDQSMEGRQSIQNNNQQPSDITHADPGSDFPSQTFKATDVQRENVLPQNVAPSVRTKTVPAQHAVSSMGNGNYVGGNVRQSQPDNNPNTNHNNPQQYAKSPENHAMASANANPVVNSNPNKNYKGNAPQRQPPSIKPQMSPDPEGKPNRLPDKDYNNRLSNQHREPSNENRFAQQLDQRNNRPSPQGAFNRAYTEGGPPEGIPVNRPVSQRVKSLSNQKQPLYQQQSPSRTVNRTSVSSLSVQKTGLKVKQPKESHYLSKPSDSSSSSSSSSSGRKPQLEPQRTNPHQNLQPSSSGDKMPGPSQAQAGSKPSGYKSPDSSSSSLSSHSNPSDSSNWSDNDVYLPYGGDMQKFSPSGRQSSQGRYYGQSSQYYRPYSSDSLNSLPSSYLGNAGSQDDFSQFGGPYIEPQKPASQLQYQLNNGNPGYMNYPESSYNSQFSSPNRYNNFGGDFSSTNYQDPDFYLSLGNPPAYHQDGLYDDNQPSEMSHPDTMKKNKDESQGGMPEGPANPVPVKSRPPVKEEPEPSNVRTLPPVAHTTVGTQPPATPSSKKAGASNSAKVNHTDPATSKPPHHSEGPKEQVFLSREKVIIASSSSEAEGPIIALSLGLAFTIVLIGLLACRLRNMKHRLRKGRPLNSNEADYLINGMYL